MVSSIVRPEVSAAFTPAPAIDFAKIDDDAIGFRYLLTQFASTFCAPETNSRWRPKGSSAGEFVALQVDTSIEEPGLVDLHIAEIANVRTSGHIQASELSARPVSTSSLRKLKKFDAAGAMFIGEFGVSPRNFELSHF